MKDNMYFSVSTFTTADSGYPMTENYNYWVPLIAYFLNKSDEIEIQCWNDEVPTIKELKVGTHFDILVEENLTAFRGKITDGVENLLLHNHIDQDGRLKWFTIFFKKNNFILFSSQHWATEFFVSEVNEDDVFFIKSIMPKETIYHRYK